MKLAIVAGHNNAAMGITIATTNGRKAGEG